MHIPIKTIIFILSIILITIIQIQLSKNKNRYLGLIIPFFNIMLTFIIMLNATTPSEVIMVLIIYSIPTTVNLAIYFSCRKRIKKIKNSEIDRMTIDDLE